MARMPAYLIIKVADQPSIVCIERYCITEQLLAAGIDWNPLEPDEVWTWTGKDLAGLRGVFEELGLQRVPDGIIVAPNLIEAWSGVWEDS